MNTPAFKEDEKWSCASFSVFSDKLTHEEIGARLGIKATRTHAKGQPRGYRRKDGSISPSVVWPHSAWHLGSPLGYDANLVDHIKWLLDSIEPKLAVLKMLSAECHLILLQCCFSSACGQGGFTLDGDTLGRISRLGLSLSLDLYPPGAPDGSDEEGT
jgi:hypothetical protein